MREDCGCVLALFDLVRIMTEETSVSRCASRGIIPTWDPFLVRPHTIC